MKDDSLLDEMDSDGASDIASSSMKRWDAELSEDDGGEGPGHTDLEEETVVDFEEDSEEEDVEPQKKGKFPVALVVAGVAVLGIGGFVGFSQIFGSSPPAVAQPSSIPAPVPVLDDGAFDGDDSGKLFPASSSGVSVSSDSFSSVISGLQGESVTVSAPAIPSDAHSSLHNIGASSQSQSSVSRVIYPPISQDTRVSPGIPAGQLAVSLNSTEEVNGASSSWGGEINGNGSAYSSSLASSSISFSSAYNVESNVVDLDVVQLKKMLSSISDELKDLKRMQKESDLKIEETSKKINSASLSGSKVESNASTSEGKSELKKERKRLPGFKITSASHDGKMSIVAVERGNYKNVIVLFEGEKFTSSVGALKVTGVEHNGDMLLIGSDWFIDKTLEPVVISKTKKEVVKPRSSSSSSSISSSSSTSSTSSVSSMIIAQSRPASPSKAGFSVPTSLSAGGVAEGWVFNGIYNDQFLISSPSGGLSQVKKGDRIQGLGVVSGVNASGDLLVGSFRIKTP